MVNNSTKDATSYYMYLQCMWANISNVYICSLMSEMNTEK